MNLSSLVEQILRDNEQARNSDKTLIIEVLQHRGANLTPHQIQLMRDMSFESIRRTRQKLQEQGKYRADPNIAKERRFKSYRMQQNMPTAKPQQVERILDNEQIRNDARQAFNF